MVDNKKLERLKKVLEVMGEDTITYADLDRVMREFAGVIRDLKAEHTKTTAQTKGDLTAEIKQLADLLEESKIELEKIIRQTNVKTLFDAKSLISELHTEIRRLDTAITSIPDLTGRIAEVEAKIPEIDDAEDIRNKLEVLQGDERLDKSAIKGLEEELEAIRKTKSETKIIGGGPTRRGLRKYSLTSQCDGITKAFTLPIDTTDVIGVFGTQFPVQFDPSADWTFEGRTLTLGASVGAPETGQTLWALIETL